jgi:hypothetical protein
MARADVKARMIELAAPAQAAIEAELSINLEKTERRLAAIIFADIDLATAKVPDVIAAVRQLAAMRGGNAPNRTEIGGPNGSPIEVTSDADRARLMAFMARHHAVASDSHEN